MGMDRLKHRCLSPLAAGGVAAGATTINLAAGEGSKWDAFPGDSFIALLWNATDFPNPSDDPDVEHVLVTGRAGDALTVQRGKESTTDRNHNAAGKTYKVFVSPTEQYFGQVRTRINNLEKVAFRAIRSGGANQLAVPAGVDTKVQFNAESFDLSAEYDPATNFRYTALKPTILRATMQLRFLSISAAGKTCQAKLFKNGVVQAIGEVISPAAGNIYVRLSDLIQLAANDYVEAFANQADVAARDIDGASTASFLAAEAAGVYNRE